MHHVTSKHFTLTQHSRPQHPTPTPLNTPSTTQHPLLSFARSLGCNFIMILFSVTSPDKHGVK